MSKLPNLTDSLLTLEERVATLTFNRHDVRNALTGTALMEDLVKTADWVNRDPAISALIVTGAGSAFSSGGNLKEMGELRGRFGEDPVKVQEDIYRQTIQRMPLAMESIEVPTIAAVNGAAIGAGFDVCNMCDIRIGCPESVFSEAFINLAILPGDGGSWFLPRVVGYQRALELSVSGRRVKAEEALKLNILMEVVASEMLLTRARQIAEEFASKPPRSVRMTKRLLKAAQRLDLRDLLDMCASMQSVSHQMKDHHEAVSALIEGRSPKFGGN